MAPATSATCRSLTAPPLMRIAATSGRTLSASDAIGVNEFIIVGMLLWQFTRPVLWANLIAWPAGWYTMHRWLERFAYRTDIQPWMLLSASGLAIVIALATVATHAVVVARARPATALRYE